MREICSLFVPDEPFYVKILLPLALIMVNNQFPNNDPEKINILSLRLIDDILMESKTVGEAEEKLQSAIRYLKIKG